MNAKLITFINVPYELRLQGGNYDEERKIRS